MYKAALIHYGYAMAIDPKDHTLYSNQALVWYNMLDFGKALESAEKCIELNPNFAKGYFRKGKVLVELNRLDEAIAAYK